MPVGSDDPPQSDQTTPIRNKEIAKEITKETLHVKASFSWVDDNLSEPAVNSETSPDLDNPISAKPEPSIVADSEEDEPRQEQPVRTGFGGRKLGQKTKMGQKRNGAVRQQKTFGDSDSERARAMKAAKYSAATVPVARTVEPVAPTGPTWQEIAAEWERVTGKPHGCDPEHCRSWIPDVEKAGRDAIFAADRLEIFARCRRMFDVGKGAWLTFQWLFKTKAGGSVGWWRIRSREFEWQETVEAARPASAGEEAAARSKRVIAQIMADAAKAKETPNATNA